MIYMLLCACAILYALFAYFFVKTYQLNGYNIGKFWGNCFALNFSIGDKNKLVFTKRIIRFYIVLTAFVCLLSALPMLFVGNGFLAAFDVCVVFVLTPVWITVVHYLILPLEILIKQYYIIKAKNKLGKKNIVKIGITGSYGKTSTKNILTHILEKQYKVCATPKNYNTEMGTTLTVLKHLDDHDVFIAEMGARKPRDIEKLTKNVNPDYAVITSIGNCHIETFKTLENIENTKFELAKFIKPEGVVFFGESDSTYKLFKRFDGNKVLTCRDKSFAYAENVTVNQYGCEFDLIIDQQQTHVKTKLLGKFNIDNIVVASAVAYKLGIKLEDIKMAIKTLEPSPHRLELIQNDYCSVLDDAYNSNEIGFKEALKVLSKFEGRKIVVTPGMVELGSKQSQINFALGCMIADECDYLIIMNEVNKNDLLSGAISHGMKRENIYFASTRAQQSELVKLLTCKGAVVLFENDLPDNYS
ncbi:MAG: UDP-N-acetylmuramoyl-tripeptide--D-alanyl-D-alanine ligase [Clostridia bacterium]|nr:UDP-N-acetylmuramoyl-tripeptide--D-alanyl-D-alanine ligase [Clostridia bacterium]